MNADPVWLADVLRAEGLRCDEYPGCYDRGHGDFHSIWGVIVHHTGASGSPGPGAIAEHPELGLCSQLHLARDGLFTVCGVGIAWHAGEGWWPGIPTNGANDVTIGIEAENNGTEGWSHAQTDAYVRGVAAILRHLGYHSDRVIGHKEWAAVQGKWDPGLVDMPNYRRNVQRVIEEGSDDMSAAETQEILAQLREIRNQLTASPDLGQFPGWESRRFQDGPLDPFRATATDYLREIDREVNGRLPVGDENVQRPLPFDEPDSTLGHVLSLRAEVLSLREQLRSVFERIFKDQL